MKSEQDPELTPDSRNLHKLVSLAAGNLMPKAVQRNSFIVNEVPREFQIAADETIVATILNSLLTTVVNNSKHSCIRVKAREYEDVIFVSVRDNNSDRNYDVNGNLEEINLLAKKMNGTVIIENIDEKMTTILLSFPNFPKAA
ncbi:MAG: hypothetical protein WKI04_04745 [Ferruginibacter sp.]